jgi:hypothetical protein
VAAFGMILKDSPYKGDATLPWVLDTASDSAVLALARHPASFATDGRFRRAP